MPMIFACFNCDKSILRFPCEARSPTLFCSYSCRASYQAKERMIQTPEQFWAKVAIGRTGDCWEWTGYRVPTGYGQSAWKGKVLLAHRIALSLTDGEWDSKLHVLHTCDNPPCCNPAHLWRGTDLDNQRDKVAKGRQRNNPLRGEDSPHAKLTQQQVLAIRASQKRGAELAAEYRVSQTTISSVRNYRTWKGAVAGAVLSNAAPVLILRKN